MQIENWNKNVGEVTNWLNLEDRGDEGQAITLSITLGNNCKNDELRSTYWTAIRSIGSVFDDFPKARRGRESALPDDMEAHATSVMNAVYSAFVSLTNPQIILATILPHGRTGGAYKDMDAIAKEYAAKAYRNLVTGYKEGRWTGEMDGDVPLMTPPPVKAEMEVKEEE